MGKRRRRNVKSTGLKQHSEQGKPSPRVFPKRYCADYIRPRGGIAKDVHFVLNRRHIESAGVPDSGQSGSVRTVNGVETVAGRPHSPTPIPASKLSKSQLLAEAFVLPRIEVARLRNWAINNNGEIVSIPWQHIVLEKTENWRFCLFWRNDKVLFVSDNTATKKLAVSRRTFSSVIKAKQFYLANGYQAIPMGPRRTYEGSSPDP